MNKPFILTLPYEKLNGEKCRDVVTTIVKACWKAVNEWTAALNSGLIHLKSVVAILVSMKDEDELPLLIHSDCQEISTVIEVMKKKVVKTLESLTEQLKRLIDVEEKVDPGSSSKPLFSTISFTRFYEVISYISESYKKETSIKAKACLPLPFTYDADTLNSIITLWTNHLYLPQPHLYHIKILLYEAQLL